MSVVKPAIRRLLGPLCAIAVVVASGLSRADDSAPLTDVTHIDGKLADGAAYVIDMPARWNGVLLLWSHGYAFALPAADDASPGDKDWLLAHGYALAGSAYSQAGWAVEQAVPDQVATLDAFAARFGKPKTTIAWGASMGGLVTAALAERYPGRINAALPMCGSVAGAVGMMNEALDGAFVLRTLIAPTSDIRLVDIVDDHANGALAAAAVRQAQTSPDGRARIALAGVLAGLPGWSDPSAPQPQPDDLDAQEAQMAQTFAMGVFTPRNDQEHRAGGVFSWNTGVDYRAQLAKSGRRAFVEALYANAGLNLDADLDALNAAARVAAEPAAVAYMAANFSPSGTLRIPVLTLHTIGDGLTSVTGERAYHDTVAAAGSARWLAQTYVAGAGHCRFQPSEPIAALQVLQGRLRDGAWRIEPAVLNAAAKQSGLGPARFVEYRPTPFLRDWAPTHQGASHATVPAQN